MMSRRPRRIAVEPDSALSPRSSSAAAVDLEMQPLSPRSSSGAAASDSAAAPAVSSMDPLRKVDAQPREHRPLVLRVSPLVFLLIPAICFYLSALLASFTLHLSSDGAGGSTGVGEDAPCSSSLRLFLWGAVILGYAFVLGFAAMVVGPRTSALSPRLRWAMLLLFAGLLGALTALGGRQVLRGASRRCQEHSAYFQVCSYICAFYLLWWLVLLAVLSVEFGRAFCCPSRGRVVVMGVGAGLEKLRMSDLPISGLWAALADKFPKFPPPAPQQPVVAVAPPSRRPSADTTAQGGGGDEHEESAGLLSSRTDNDNDDDGGRAPQVRKDNFVANEGSAAGSDSDSARRRKLDQPEEKYPAQAQGPRRFNLFGGGSSNAVAPEPSPPAAAAAAAGSDAGAAAAAAAQLPPPVERDGEDTPTKRRRKIAERAQAEAAAAAAALLSPASPSLMDEFNRAAATGSGAGAGAGADPGARVDPLTQPTPAQRRVVLPPLQGSRSNQVGDSSLLVARPALPARADASHPRDDGDDDSDGDQASGSVDAIFAAKIAANRAAQAARRRELAEVERQEQAQHSRPLSYLPLSLPLPPPPPPAPSAAPAPAGILKSPSHPRDTFKMVEFESGSRMEEHRPPSPERSWEESASGVSGEGWDQAQPQALFQQVDPFAPVQPSPAGRQPAVLPPLSGSYSYAQGAAPLPPSMAYNPNSALSPSAAASSPYGFPPPPPPLPPQRQWPPPPPPLQQLQQPGPRASPGAQIALSSPPLFAGGWNAPATPAAGFPHPLPSPQQQHQFASSPPPHPMRYHAIIDHTDDLL